ncbi:hypothetical protein NEOLEDRAFT_1091226 [Neolentinus lepideus HHB14362 ss-1]|uniref:DAGKc domain-containing protein n=1 Tax=Neolentinus lepideus HHB14362 ss-1 TaxID=1314782 RepID=A0A165T9T3_9AGAM|nr:hypothetical protein NEOLEDRAFT_1091226 [Neolentinus lepideus HHB14362 ss-1]
MASHDELRVVNDNGKLSSFKFTDTSLLIGRETKKIVDVPLRQIIWVEHAGDRLEVHFLARKRKKSPFGLVKATGRVYPEDNPLVDTWIANLMDKAYDGIGVKQCRRFKVLINPQGGQGKAVTVFRKKVEPIFSTAHCTLDVTYTRRAKHASDIAKELPLSDFDAVVTVSGDGLIHEVINGFAEHEQPFNALNIPISPIPTGSGNGLSCNILGIQDAFDVSAAALNAIKGRPMKTDLFSFTQNNTRRFSFFSQALGLMADLDLGTEHLRWMGDTRFVVGFLRGIVKYSPCPATLSIKVVESDKTKLIEKWKEARAAPLSLSTGSTEETSGALPPLNFDPQSKPDDDGWITFDKPLLYVYAGQGPYVGRDLMQFPISLPDDGLIDVVAQELSSRADMLKAMDGAENGSPFWLPGQHYYKAHAYRITPHSKKGCLSIDGEGYPFEEYQVEVHPKLGTLLSMHGRYATDFKLLESPK